MELVAVVVARDQAQQSVRLRDRVAVELEHFGQRDRVFGNIEIRCIGKQEAQRIANAPVAFDHALQDFVGNEEVAGIIGGADPKPQDLGAERRPYLLRRHHVAPRLRHLLAFTIDHEAVSQERLVGWDAIQHAR